MNIRIQRGKSGTFLTIGLLAVALAAPSLAPAQGPTSELIFFGDSLSDSGNAFALQRENNTPPSYSVDALLIPDDAYARGGHHFSNGPTWAEDFANSLGLAADANPSFRDANPRATDYAVGGARASGMSEFNLPIQVDVFLQDFGGHAPSDALYVIEIGGNDLRDALAAVGAGQDPAPIIAAAVAGVAANITALYQAGAREFLVWNAPNIGLTPAVRALGPNAMAAGLQLTLLYNGNLATVLTSLAALPGIEITPFDLFGALNAIVANPSAFGLTDVVDACISPNDPPFICSKPDSYLFWDGIHPTKAAHAILAQAVATTLGY
jgi:phospholipase/lecithinase/hemolysin